MALGRRHAYDGPQLPHHGSRLGVVPLDVADDQDQPVLDLDGVEPVASHLHARVAAAVARRELDAADAVGEVREQAALESHPERPLLGELPVLLLVAGTALDGEGHRPHQDVDEGEVVPTRLRRLGVVHRERPEQLPGASRDRRGPAGAQSGAEGEVLEVGPQRVCGDVLDDHLLVEVGRGAARPDRRPDLDAVDGLVVVVGQARRGPVQEPRARLVAQQDRGEHALRGDALDDQQHRLQGVRELGSGHDAGQQLELRGEEGRIPSLVVGPVWHGQTHGAADTTPR